MFDGDTGATASFSFSQEVKSMAPSSSESKVGVVWLFDVMEQSNIGMVFKSMIRSIKGHRAEMVEYKEVWVSGHAG